MANCGFARQTWQRRRSSEKLKNIETEKVVDNTFAAGHKIDPVRIETEAHVFIQRRRGVLHEHRDLRADALGQALDRPAIPERWINCLVVFHAEEERPISRDLPSHVELEITYTEPGVKGDATYSLKPATVDTGAEVRVPLFINNGDWIKVDTRSGDYTERIKK